MSSASLYHFLKQAGYTDVNITYLKQASPQGSISIATSAKNEPNTYTIKTTNKTLHEQSSAYINGRFCVTQQNITKELSILQYLLSSEKATPSALIQYKHFLCDKYNYYLLTEDIGESMFNIVTKCHQLIRNKRLDIDEWHTFCRIAMQQIVELLEWMHNTMHCCHLDVSLENITVKNMHIIVTPSTGKVQICPDFQVKLINFGLAQVFQSKNDDGEIDFRCNKYVGKTSYKAPKVFAETSMFDARGADCWSLAVCFFKMLIGSAPFQMASVADQLFNYIMNDQMMDVLKSWGVMHYVTPPICHLLQSLFVVEKDRLTMSDLKQHHWLKLKLN